MQLPVSKKNSILLRENEKSGDNVCSLIGCYMFRFSPKNKCTRTNRYLDFLINWTVQLLLPFLRSFRPANEKTELLGHSCAATI